MSDTEKRPRDFSTDDDPDAQSDRRRRLRFEQARSVGIVLTLGVLLVLVLYNTVAEGRPWQTREKDVRLLMTLLSLLLGLDVVMGNRRELAQLVGEVLVSYARPDDETAGESDTETETDTE